MIKLDYIEQDELAFADQVSIETLMVLIGLSPLEWQSDPDVRSTLAHRAYKMAISMVEARRNFIAESQPTDSPPIHHSEDDDIE